MNQHKCTPPVFVRHFLSAIANAVLYSMNHPQVTRLADTACSCLADILASSPSLTIMILDNELVIDNQPQPYSLYFERLARIIAGAGIGYMEFLPGVTEEDLLQLIMVLAGKDDKSSLFAHAEHVKTGALEVSLNDMEPSVAADSALTTRQLLADLSSKEMGRFMDIYESVKKRRKLHISGIYEMVSGFIKVFQQEGESLLVLGDIRNNDEYTFTHSTNVCILNIAQAMALGIQGGQLHDIGIAAMLHDIGKVFIPEEILSKPGKLTPEEFAIMQSHPVRGARYLLDTPGVPQLAVVTAYEHHLKFDLSGYPRTESTWKTNLCSHLTMISDFFDALRTKRSYRDPMEYRAIAAMMLEMRGKEFHPGLMDNFFTMFNRILAEPQNNK